MEKVAQNDILFVFPSESQACTTLRVLKTPKTEKSTRKVFLPETVARMLEERKKEQESMKDLLGDEYHDYNLVITSVFGMPMGESSIREAFYKLIKEHDLPQVVFHSLRHTSITYKLKLNGGDIKSVQGDSGHAQVSMVTEVYSHILDEERRKNAQLFEEAFYRRKELNPKIHNLPEGNVLTVPEGVNVELLAKVLANPEMTALLTALAKSMG